VSKTGAAARRPAVAAGPTNSPRPVDVDWGPNAPPGESSPPAWPPCWKAIHVQQVIDAYLTLLAAGLPGPAYSRAAILTEIGDGLRGAVADDTARGALASGARRSRRIRRPNYSRNPVRPSPRCCASPPLRLRIPAYRTGRGRTVVHDRSFDAHAPRYRRQC
jgi:hypothetical protein